VIVFLLDLDADALKRRAPLIHDGGSIDTFVINCRSQRDI